MKHLLFPVLAAAAWCCAACDSATQPVASEPTIFSGIAYAPTVAPDEEAEIEAVLTNPSGIYNAWIVYYLDDASDRTQIVAEKRCNGTKSVEFSGRIPAQKEGTKVTFQLATLNMAGDLTPSEVCTYTVAAPEE